MSERVRTHFHTRRGVIVTHLYNDLTAQSHTVAVIPNRRGRPLDGLTERSRDLHHRPSEVSRLMPLSDHATHTVPLPLVYKDVLEVHRHLLLHHHFHHSLTLRLHQKSSLQDAFPNHPRTACHGHLCSSRSHNRRSQGVLPFRYDLHQLMPCCADTRPPQISQLSRREAEPGLIIDTGDASVGTPVLSSRLG